MELIVIGTPQQTRQSPNTQQLPFFLVLEVVGVQRSPPNNSVSAREDVTEDDLARNSAAFLEEVTTLYSQSVLLVTLPSVPPPLPPPSLLTVTATQRNAHNVLFSPALTVFEDWQLSVNICSLM